MAASITELAITWSAAASVTVSSSTVVWSDVLALTAADYDYQLQVSADNAGTAASGDTCTVYVAKTTGDILGDSGNDYDTVEHSAWSMTLDTYATSTPGEDPARKTQAISVSGAVGIKIGVSCPQAGTRNIVVRARLSCQRPA